MNGLITIPSNFPVKETIDRLAAMIVSKGMTVFARIDHAKNAEDQGMELRPTELIIFGNPRAGTVLMQDKQTSGIDLPLKALSWQDETGKVWLTYNDSGWLEQRHKLTGMSGATLQAIQNGLATIADAAAR